MVNKQIDYNILFLLNATIICVQCAKLSTFKKSFSHLLGLKCIFENLFQ